MTLTLDKLRALKRQAGATDTPAPPASSVPSSLREPVRDVATRTGAPWDAVLQDDLAARKAANDASLGGVPHADATTPSAASSNADAPVAPVNPAQVDATSTDAAAPTEPSPARRGVDVDALRRLLGLRERAPSPASRPRHVDRSLPGTEIADGLWLIESRVAHSMPQAPLPLAFARRDGHVDAGNLLFFDTETTGLAGGTGTRAFMIGAADWFEGALRVRQLFIANMAAEGAMLRTFASWLSPSTVLASYNGRSYDAPLLRTRYRLARQKDPLHGLDHLDLLHPSRRRWRGRWENCRLATIEREALRILREDDLPGSQAPAAWLSYLRGGASTNLRRVAEHNRQDVATLSQLLVLLCDGSQEKPE